MRNMIATGVTLFAITVALPATLALGIIVRLHCWAVQPLVALGYSK
jgi:hypothetical protein